MANLIMSMQRRNPYPAYWLLRHARPLFFLARYNVWMVSRYEDVKRVLTDHDSFGSDFSSVMGEAAENRPVGASLIATDPPIHTKLRNLVTRAFTSRAVASLERRIARLADEMLDGVIETGRTDLVQDLAYPLPVIVIAEMLGVPAADRARFKEWSDQVTASADRIFTDQQDFNEEPEQIMPRATMAQMGPYFHEIIEQRRVAPRDDLISGLIAAEIDGERLTEQDILSFCSLLLVAGNVTTTNLIANAVLTLLEHPRALARLRADMSLLPGAIEEVLRYRSPVQAMFRMARRDLTLGGQTIRTGQLLAALMGSANRDETRFARANRFDITRSPNPHLAFGHGIHFCLGAPLARLEARVALAAILERLPDLVRADRGPLEPANALILNGVKRLPLRFTPGSRIAAA